MDKLITAAQDLTTSWVNLGAPISMANYEKLALWIDVDINDSTDVRFRALPMKKNDSSAVQYNFPITYTSSTKISIEDEYFELTTDADQNFCVKIDTYGLVPYLQIQVQVGAEGATAGQIDSAEVNKA